MSLLRYTPGGGTSSVGSSKGASALGPVGATGPTGPSGPNSIPSAFAARNGSDLVLTTSYQVVLQTTITSSVVGYLIGNAVVQIINQNTGTDHTASIYMEVNGSTSNTTSEDIRKKSGGVDGAANLSILHRTANLEPIGTYNITLYAKCDTNNGLVVVNHADMYGLANLS